MYTIYNDGQLLFSTDGVDDEHIILSPKCSLDVNGAGSLEFVMPPGHALYDSVRKLKSIITVEQDGQMIFRGRAMDDEKDFYNQKNVYCEGDRSFLLDSQCAPYTYTGTVISLFRKLIDNHNSQVDADKWFSLGNVTAVSEQEILTVENVAYWETWKEIDEKLLSVYGGYMMTRTEGGTTYLDWLAQSGESNDQTIQFSVNLLDLKDKVDAADVFTILIPLGASTMGEDGEYTDPVNIASVNGGKNYIQDDDAVALYGKIWRTKTWNHIEDPTTLLAKGREHLKTGIALQTLSLTAVDMHFIDSSAEAIRIGEYVHIVSNPHGIDITMNCTKLEIDLINPENTAYTFGEPPRTLTENVVRAEEDLGGLTGGGGGRGVKEELKDYIRWADIRADEDEALIELLTGEVSNQGKRLSKAEITLDGVNAQIVAKASKEETDELGKRISDAEVEIDGLNAEIVQKASQEEVDGLGNRVSSAESSITVNAQAITSKVSKNGVISAINQTAESVLISADKINLEGYVTASTLASDLAVIDSITMRTLNVSGAASADSLNANSAAIGTLRVSGNAVSLKQATFLTNSTTLTVNATGGTVTGVTLNKKTATINYLSYG